VPTVKPRVAEKNLPQPVDGTIIVQPGETVYSISRREKVPISAIVKENNLPRPYVLQVGQRIRLPAMADYIVKPGDTYETVAASRSVPVEELADINSDVQSVDLPPLQAGDTIRVPTNGQPTPLGAISTTSDGKANGSGFVKDVPVQQENTMETGTTKYNLVPMGPTTSTAPLEETKPATPNAYNGTFEWPVVGRVVKDYAANGAGIDIAAPAGTPITAAAGGTVIEAGNIVGTLGKVVLIRHEGGYVTAYGHLDRVLVDEDSIVGKGDVIGTTGTSGGVKVPQVHFEIRQGETAVDPQPMLPPR